MTRKQFLVLLLAVAVLGGAGLALMWQRISDYRASEARIGAKLLPDFRIADVAEIALNDGKQRTTLVRREKRWVVRERNDYPANFEEISDLMIKLVELKVTQSEQVGASLWPRLELAEPTANPGEGAGTLIEFRGEAGKPLARLVLGKKVLKRDPLNPLPTAKDGVPAGRYLRVGGVKDRVIVVSDPLNSAEADAGRWLDKDFFKVERIRTLQVEAEGRKPGWKIARNEEWGQWKFAAGGGQLNPGAAVSAVNKLSSLSFKDVAAGERPKTTGRPVQITAETFDRLTYTIRLEQKAGSDDYLLNFNVKGEPPAKREREKGEKPEETERRDKDYAETLKQLKSRLAGERALERWTYVVSGQELEALLVSRSDLVVSRRERK